MLNTFGHLLPINLEKVYKGVKRDFIDFCRFSIRVVGEQAQAAKIYIFFITKFDTHLLIALFE